MVSGLFSRFLVFVSFLNLPNHFLASSKHMRPLIQEISTAHTSESLAAQLRGEPGLVLLRSALFDSPQARYSFLAARPFLTFRSSGSRCELHSSERTEMQFGNPWHLLDSLMS